MNFKKITGAAAVGLGLSLSIAPAAHASDYDGTLNSNEMLFFYNSNLGGSFADFLSQRTNLAGYTFLASGNGQGQAVKNNSASVDSWRNTAARVHFNSNFGGPYDYVDPLEARNLSVTYNDNASFDWYPWG